MADVLLFHHAQGLTSGVLAFAERLRAAGHAVDTPDLYEGRTFDSLEDGIAHAGEIGFPTVIARGREAAAELPESLAYVGLSLGVLPAQALAQTRPGARAAVLLHSCVPPEEFGGPWPPGVPLQIHIMEDDALASPPEVDLETARRLDETVEDATLFLYPGDRHLFMDESLGDHDATAAGRAERRILGLLERL